MGKPANFRSDSVLGNFPQERQEQIASWITECKEGDRYEHARWQLAEDGVNVSRTAVADWYRGWVLRARLHSAESFSLKVQELFKKLNPAATADQLDAAGQLAFTDAAIEDGNASLFKDLEYLRVTKQSAKFNMEIERAKLKLRQQAENRAERKLKLEWEKLLHLSCEKILAAARDPKTREVAEDASLSNAEKIALMRKEYFADIDAMPELELPK